MPTKQVGIAEAFGVPPDSIEGNFRIRPPEDPAKQQRAHERDMYILALTWRLSGAAIGLAFALSWLFLHYGKPDQAEKVVATAIGIVGGIGLGKITPSKD